ncbi:MAG: hypothetical protein ACRCYE_15160 [Sarcina sp.]
MNKKLVSLLMAGAMIGGVGASAAATVNTSSTPTKTVVSNHTLLAAPSSSSNTTTNKSTTATTTTATTNSNKDQHKTEHKGEHRRFHVDKKLVKTELEKGQTVSQIKESLVSTFNSNMTKRVAAKKISQDKATQVEKDFAAHIQKTDILRGIVVNQNIAKELNSGKTLQQATQSFLAAKTTELNTLVSQHKITQEQATKTENNLKTQMSKGHGIFLNEGMVNKIRKDIDSGMTVPQVKQNLIKQADAKAQNLVKEGKIKSANLPKVEKHIENRIDHNPAFKNLSNVGWVQKALNEGQTEAQIQKTMTTKINQKEAKVEANTKLSQTQKSNIKTHLENLQKNISAKGIFSGLMGF